MTSILSTKRLIINQQELLLNAGVSFVAYDAIDIKPISFTLSRKHKNIIVTSQNGARLFLENLQKTQDNDIHLFCVGEKTTALLEKNDLKVVKTAQNGQKLGLFITKNYKNESFSYFCGKQRRDELPSILKEATITFEEIVIYETHLNKRVFNRTFDGVLFFSPSAVQAFVSQNKAQTTAFCIGETTANKAREYFKNVVTSNATSVESTIAKTVNYLKK